jgi:hypothetical protein
MPGWNHPALKKPVFKGLNDPVRIFLGQNCFGQHFSG